MEMWTWCESSSASASASFCEFHINDRISGGTKKKFFKRVQQDFKELAGPAFAAVLIMQSFVAAKWWDDVWVCSSSSSNSDAIVFLCFPWQKKRMRREGQKLDRTDDIQVISNYYKKYRERLDIANLEDEERKQQQESTSSGGGPESYDDSSLSYSSSFSLFVVSPHVHLFSLRLQFIVVVGAWHFFLDPQIKWTQCIVGICIFIDKCSDVADKSGDQRDWEEHMRSPTSFRLSLILFWVRLILLSLLILIWLL